MINFYVPDDTTGIAVRLSGGADSSIIYYGLIKYLHENELDIPVYVVSMDTDVKSTYSHYAKKVIKFTEDVFGISPVEHKICLLKSPWTIAEYDSYQHDIMLTLMQKYNANLAYTGLTQNPPWDKYKAIWQHPDLTIPNEEFIDHLIATSDHSRDDYSAKPAITRHPEINGYTQVIPFQQTDKKEVAQAYVDLGVMDTLYPITYSCEEVSWTDKQPLQAVDGVMEWAHCGRCFFCIERVYGFDRLI